MKDAQKNKIIDLNYIDPFNYKFIIIKKLYVFKSYMDITNIVEEANEREIIRQLLFPIYVLT
jgi:hypothetical protein